MSLGNGNPKNGDKGSNFNYELKALQGLESIAKKLETGIVKKIVAGTGVTISPTTGVGNVTINAAVPTGPTTLTFGGNLNFQVGSESYAYNTATALTQVYSTPTPVFATVGRNFWIDISIQTGNYAGPPYSTSNFSVKLYASVNGITLNTLLGTYTVPVTAANTVYKMQRTFFTGSIIDSEGGDEYYVFGVDATTSLNSDSLISSFNYVNSIGAFGVSYPYLVVAVQAGASNVYRLGPSRITYA
jgi:hypothetical protein